MKKNEFIERYGIEAYQIHLEKQKQYRQQNKENIADYEKQYRQQNKEKIDEYNKQYYQQNKEKFAEYQKQYRQENKNKIDEYKKQYRKLYNKTPMGRAIYLANGYSIADKKYNRGKSTITAQWIVDNIFTSKCYYCGESDWEKLGCDRIDNSLPHTPDNVVCCCMDCNIERQKTNFIDFCKRKGVA